MEPPEQHLLFPLSRKLSGGERLHSLRNAFLLQIKREKQAQMRILGNAKWLPYGACCHGNTLLRWTTLGTGCKELQRSITKAAT